MFGYVKTDLPNMYVKDTILYKASYCGLCKSLGKSCGQLPRFTLSYDLSFLSVFLHCILGIDFKINKQHCVIHPFRKVPICEVDDLSIRIANLNLILAYHKIKDDVIDENKGKALLTLFKSKYKKAKNKESKLDIIVDKNYQLLRNLEVKNSSNIDVVGDCFSQMMVDIVKELVGDKFDENIYNVSYNLGKWIYLIDALDDFDKDKKKKSFNVLNNYFSDCTDKKSLLLNKRKDLEKIFGEVLYQIYFSSKKISYKFNHDLLDNILQKGLKQVTFKIMEGNKCTNTTKF